MLKENHQIQPGKIRGCGQFKTVCILPSFCLVFALKIVKYPDIILFQSFNMTKICLKIHFHLNCPQPLLEEAIP